MASIIRIVGSLSLVCSSVLAFQSSAPVTLTNKLGRISVPSTKASSSHTTTSTSTVEGRWKRTKNGIVSSSIRPEPWWRDPAATVKILDPSASSSSKGEKVLAKGNAGGLNKGWKITLMSKLGAVSGGGEPKRFLFSLFLPIILGLGGGGPFTGGGSSGLLNSQPAAAIDSIKVGTCLIQNCQAELARCILDPKCLANIICLNTCNNKPDEVGCQIKCGDLFENEIVGKFNACALSKKQCVPQKQDDESFPVPPPGAIANQFDMNMFKGKWYISSGLNPLFDCFDCQVHFFTIQGGKLYGKLNWRITEPDGEFFTRNTVQRFVQDPENPGILYNHDNEYLHYQDDWYIVDYEPEQFICIYYRGRNDAWVGYGGAVVYSKAASVPPKYRDRIKNSFAKAGLDFSKFKDVDNSCSDLRVSPSALRAEFAKRLFITEEQQLQEALTSARVSASNALMMKEEEAQTAVQELEKVILEFEGKLGKELEKEVGLVEEEITKDVGKVAKSVFGRVIDTSTWKQSNQGSLDNLVEKLQTKPLELKK